QAAGSAMTMAVGPPLPAMERPSTMFGPGSPLLTFQQRKEKSWPLPTHYQRSPCPSCTTMFAGQAKRATTSMCLPLAVREQEASPPLQVLQRALLLAAMTAL